ncbi:MAG TPA: hypothetical protein VMD28_06445 [Acidimicrobiales bacterium]|nr:hypothetical protein [Acidimicrobiales bacterium]
MRKYLTRRCICLHALVFALVPAFLLAGWWQYHVALGGNDLSWVYTVEWPFFAVYSLYIWWKLIHDESTPFDRLWAAKQRAAADAEGRPLHEIPGWATDKELSREVRLASRDATRQPALSGPSLVALDVKGAMPRELARVGSELEEEPGSGPTPPLAAPSGPPQKGEGGPIGLVDQVIDAEVLEVRVNVDEELDAYNRYLFELSRSGRSKRWGSREAKRRPQARSR